MLQNARWFFRKIRTTYKYIGFLIFQLLLSTSILLIAFIHPQSFRSPIALALEYFLIFCIFLDL